MRGPSSSHTAAALRIGTMIRDLISGTPHRVIVEFDQNSSLATTYKGHGSAMGLIGGLLGMEMTNPDIINYMKLADENNMQVEFMITNYNADHPNTYKISVQDKKGKSFEIVAVSTGGGMVDIRKINDFPLSIKGDYYETLLFVDTGPDKSFEKIYNKISSLLPENNFQFIRKNDTQFLILIKTREMLPSELIEGLSSLGKVLSLNIIKPVLPVLSGNQGKLPFTTVNQMLDLSEKKRLEPWKLAVLYESVRAGYSEEKVFSLMKEIVIQIRKSIKEGLAGTNYEDRILGSQSHLIIEAQKRKRILGALNNRIIAYTSALMEMKSSMGVIVAAPTAGSCGVLGGSIIGADGKLSGNADKVTKAFLIAGMIGVFIADQYTFAAEEGGCQVECGAASSMAAAGLVQLMGGNTRMAVDAASMALQNMIGLICDPVADRVEVPCLGKNIMAATNALNSANMIMAGFEPVIPLDETIQAMKSVGKELPASLRCTGLGGLSLTPTAAKIYKKLIMKMK